MQKTMKKYFANMDEYLASIGLYRKMMARDASCLFRAVSELLYYSQNYHHKVRKDCVGFMRANRCNFEPFVEGSFEKYLERLEDPKETAGQVEIKALSLLYRRRFLIYRYPGKPPTEITEEDFVDQILLCCSNNGHYDIVYYRNYPVVAALCQSVLYEMLYTRVFGVEEAELHTALEGFRSGGRRYRNSPSVCSEDAVDDTLEDRAQREDLEWGSEEKARAGAEDVKTAEVPAKLFLSYKVLKALDGELYRNVEFDVWHDSRKEMQKTDYMVFAGRQYFLGDKCQVRLDPKGKFYNAFIQEVGTHTSAVTVFIEELGEKHLVPLTNLKPVNPVPAWNITPSRKGPSCPRPDPYPGELESDGRGRRRFFKRLRGKEMLMVSYSRPPAGLPPRFQPGPPGRGAPGMQAPMPHPGSMPYEHYHHPHPHPPRPPRGYGSPRSSGRFLNRPHLIGPEMYYPHPGKRCYQTYDNYSFRSRRSKRQQQPMNKECQFSYVAEGGEDEGQDLEGSITYYQIEEGEDNAFPPLPGQAVGSPIVPHNPSYWVPNPLPRSAEHTLASSEEDQEDRSNAEDQGDYSEEYIYAAQDTGFQSPSVYAATESTANMTIQEGRSPQEDIATYSYSQQVVVKSAVISSSQPVNMAPAAIFTSNSSSSSSSSSSQTPPTTQPPSSAHAQGGSLPPHALGRPVVSMQFPPSSPWFTNEMGEPVSVAPPPPPYSYDPSGHDLPRDCKVLQYYFNLGVQSYHQSYWHSLVQLQQVYQPPSTEAPDQAPYPSPAPQPYTPDAGRPALEGQANGSSLGVDPPPTPPPPPSAVFYPLYQEQYSQPPLQPYEHYRPVHSYQYLTPPWTPGHVHGHAPHTHLHPSYCPSSSHHLSYFTAPPADPTHFFPPSV